MKKLVLLVSTVCGFIPQFEMNNVKILQDMGCEVHYASNFNMSVYKIDKNIFIENHIITHQIDFVRSPFQIGNNYKAYKQLTKLLSNNDFVLIHCHTPMGGVLTRLAARKLKSCKVVYTAHGFHFYKGAPYLNWLLFYPVERYFAKYTDCLITINEEDYVSAQKFHLRNGGQVKKVNGVGIRKELFEKSNNHKEKTRKKYNIDKYSFLLVSIGELTKRKNHQVIINAMAHMKNENITYLICGSGEKEEELNDLIKKLGLVNRVILAGYCTNVVDILRCADCFVFPSLQEGLSVALMEAMASGLPVICSNIRGNCDLIQQGLGGYLVEKNDIDEYATCISKLYKTNRQNNFGIYNQEVIKKYQLEFVEKQMVNIYEDLLEDK